MAFERHVGKKLAKKDIGVLIIASADRHEVNSLCKRGKDDIQDNRLEVK